jgi:hypothetical protein
LADLALSAGCPYTLTTTVVRRASGRCKFTEVELHLPSDNLRLRFFDRAGFARFCFALGELAREAYLSQPVEQHPVRTRVYSDDDRTVGTSARSLLLDELLGLPY